MNTRFLLALIALCIFEPASCAQYEVAAEHTAGRENHRHRLEARILQPEPEGICEAYPNPKQEWGHEWGDPRQRYLTSFVLRVPIHPLNFGDILRFCRKNILDTLAAECHTAGKGMWWGHRPFYEGSSVPSSGDRLGPRGYCVIIFDTTENEEPTDYGCIEETLRCLGKPVKCVSTVSLVPEP